MPLETASMAQSAEPLLVCRMTQHFLANGHSALRISSHARIAPSADKPLECRVDSFRPFGMPLNPENWSAWHLDRLYHTVSRPAGDDKISTTALYCLMVPRIRLSSLTIDCRRKRACFESHFVIRVSVRQCAFWIVMHDVTLRQVGNQRSPLRDVQQLASTAHPEERNTLIDRGANEGTLARVSFDVRGRGVEPGVSVWISERRSIPNLRMYILPASYHQTVESCHDVRDPGFERDVDCTSTRLRDATDKVCEKRVDKTRAESAIHGVN